MVDNKMCFNRKRASNRNSSLIHFLIILLFLGIGYGKLSRYPFRWSDAFYSTNHTANQLAINPVLYFLNTWTRVSETYDIEKVKEFYPVMSDFLNVENPNIDNLNYSRKFNPKTKNRSELMTTAFITYFFYRIYILVL